MASRRQSHMESNERKGRQSCTAAFIFGPRWTILLLVDTAMSQAHETKAAGH
jgi:hypothetical protein